MEPVAEDSLDVYLRYADQCSGDVFDLYRAQIFRWFGCLISALSFIHRQNIRHRDIKPSNLLVHGRNILFTDFGISFELDDTTEAAETDERGTLKYRAPEPVVGMRFGRHADVFALGAVFLEMITVCCGQDNLSTFSDVCSGAYADKLEIVYDWIDQMAWLSYDSSPSREAPLSNTQIWTLTMVFLIRNMLQPIKDRAPNAIAVAMCWTYGPYTGAPPTDCTCHGDISLPHSVGEEQRRAYVFLDSLRNSNHWSFALAAMWASRSTEFRWKCCRCPLDSPFDSQEAFAIDFNVEVMQLTSCHRCDHFICEHCQRQCPTMPPQDKYYHYPPPRPCRDTPPRPLPHPSLLSASEPECFIPGEEQHQTQKSHSSYGRRSTTFTIRDVN
jgi:hypothetical protein